MARRRRSSTPTPDVPTSDVPTSDVPTSDVPTSDVPAPHIRAGDAPATDVPAPASSAARVRRIGRVFLMTAGGLAAPCLALAAFFLSNSGGNDTPATSAGVVPGPRVTAPTAARGSTTTTSSAAPTTTTTTTAPAPLVPSRDPFAPLVSPTPTGGAPAR